MQGVEGQTRWSEILSNNKWGILLGTSGMIAVGIYNIYSATFVSETLSGGAGFGFMLRHLIFLTIGFFLGYIIMRIDYRRYNRFEFNMLLSLFTIVLLGLVLLIGINVNGATRWLAIPGIGLTVQPSEFAKLVAVLWSAHCLDTYLKEQKRPVKLLYRKPPYVDWSLVAPLFFAIFTMRQPDMGTAVLILFFPAILLVLAGLKKEVILWAGASFAIGVIMFATSADYRLDRLKALWDPWGAAQGIGYQTVQGLIAVGSGGLFGQGILKGSSKYLYLPEAHTDFAFAVFAQELGFVGSLFLIASVAAFSYFGIRTALHAVDYFGMLTAAGITMIISGQAVFNMIMVAGWAPVTGVPLPFVSYGGSSLIMNCIAVAILANIAMVGQQPAKKIRKRPEATSLREETRSRFTVR